MQLGISNVQKNCIFSGEVAKQVGLSQGMLSKIERGVTAPFLGTLYALARALHAWQQKVP